MESRFRKLLALLLSLGASTALASPGSGPPSSFSEDSEGNPLDYTLTPTTPFYRGMNERQAPLSKVLRMLAHPATSTEGIPSRRWSTLQAWNPSLSEVETRSWMEQDLAFFRSQGILRTYASCHSDWYECALPAFDLLLGVSVPAFLTNPGLASVIQPRLDQARSDYQIEKGIDDTLLLFDPVISTSKSFQVALGFAQDRDPAYASFVVQVVDIQHRHCKAEQKLKHPETCFVTQTEYMDELEFPFFGEIRADELQKVTRASTEITQDTEGSVRVHTPAGDVRLTEIGIGPSCTPAPQTLGIDERIEAALRQAGLLCLSGP